MREFGALTITELLTEGSPRVLLKSATTLGTAGSMGYRFGLGPDGE